MKRRDFIKRALQFSASGLIVPSFMRKGGILSPLTALAEEAATGAAPFAGYTLVLVNYTGGNDGLNTVVPVTDPNYYAARPTIAVQPDDAVLIDPDTGLHPSLAPLLSHYTAGKMAILQGIGYDDMNLSHFRGTDIWFSGATHDETIRTGWLARFLERIFPEFPDILPEAPFGLQQALTHRIPLQGDRGVTGVVVDNPDTFYELVNANYEGEWDDELPDTRGGEELEFIRTIDRETFEYAAAIQDAAENGQNTVVYPASNLGFQLEIVAKLISGGLATPIYLTAEFGFDTHAGQVGTHNQLLASIGQSIAAFLSDLSNQGLDERVIVMTTSEFGRRVNENGGFGTDHGTAAAHFALGQRVIGGTYGTNPDLTNLDNNGNMLIQHDYRSVYQTILQDFFGGNSTIVQDVLFGDFGTLGFIEASTSAQGDDALPTTNMLHLPRPNPVSAARRGRTEVRFDLNQSAKVSLEVIDARGRRVIQLADRPYSAGRHSVPLSAEDLSGGTYFIRLTTGDWQRKTKLVVLP
jgi:uncharacterized protein (DUF1501 family)